jgi:glycosyltransferase involved in cell wall biosynthesis/tetratricopeptide (TPR) repeat protein
MELTPPKSRNDLCPCGSGVRYKHCHGTPTQLSPAASPPDPANALALRGLAAQQSGDAASAIELYRQAVALNPNHADALHMLGVAHMQRFEPEQALGFIEQAASLTGWTIAAMRHNYGWALSVLMSARPAANLQARAAAVAQVRRDRAALLLAASRTPRIGVLALCRDQAQANAVLTQMGEQTEPPGACVLLLPAVEGHALSAQLSELAHAFPITVIASTWPHSSSAMSDALAVLEAIDVDYVQLIDNAVAFTNNRLQLLSERLHESGARWGFSSAAFAETATSTTSASAAPMALDALNGLHRLAHRMRLGDLLIERLGLPITLSNLVFERTLLRDTLADELASPPTVLGLSLAAAWLAEPLFIDEHTFWLDRATLDACTAACLLPPCQAIMATFIGRILDTLPAPNALAPQAQSDGVDVLKRALRGGLGSMLSRVQLLKIAGLTRDVVQAAPLSTEGIEFIGFARAESGLGENLRSLVNAAATTSLAASLSVADIDIDSGIRNNDTHMSRYMDGRMFRTRVICVNPDLLGEAFHHDGLGRYADAYRIGFWFWELERIPRMWAEHSRLVDEIWVATDFVADAVRRDVIDRPVIKIRTPVVAPVLDRVYTRTEFGLRDDVCLFMFSFAFGSFATRKNPEATVRAFRLAFANGNERVQLVIKTSQSELFAPACAALVALAAGDPRIVFINRYLSRQALIGLQSTIDCYVSLHRSEGLGLGLAECMTQGKPTIATAYSGNLEFMNNENSFLVDHTLIPVREGEYPDFKNQVWADASVAHAAMHMKNVYEDPHRAAAVGLAGARHLAEHFNFQTVGRDILARYAAIGRAR